MKGEQVAANSYRNNVLVVQNESMIAGIPAQREGAADIDDLYHGLRLAIVDAINRDRAIAGLHPLAHDALCSEVEDAHCLEMAETQYLSHWNQRGELPYHRYRAAGGRDYVSENLSRTTVISLDPHPIPTEPAELQPLALAAHERFMSEKPPLDGHRKNVLDPAHTHVGVGLAVVAGEFMMGQLFLNRYVKLNPLPHTLPRSNSFRVEGEVLATGYGPYYAAVFYEGELRPRTAAELEKTYAYEDMTGTMIQKIAPWEMQFNSGKRQFSFTVRVNPRAAGLYHLVMWVSSPIRDIPYTLIGPGAYSVDTNKGAPGASWIFRAEP
jgi:uncharacterized protein YkwD